MSFGATAANGTRNLTFGQFDPALGTLDAVIVTLLGGAAGTDFVQNLQVTAAQVTGGLSGTLTLRSPASALFSSGEFLLSVAPTATATATLGAYDPAALTTANRGVLTLQSGGATSSDAVLLSALGRDAFTGAGTVSFAVQGSGFSGSVAGGGNFFVQTSVTEAATVTLQYRYTTEVTIPPPPRTVGSFFSSSDSGSILAFLNISYGPLFGITSPTQTQTIAPSVTDWQKSVHFTKFDPALGKLDGINVTVIGRVSTSLVVENLGAASAVSGITTTSFTLLAAPGGTVVITKTTASAGGSLASFDGTIDYSGPSGLMAQIGTTSSNGDFGTQLTDDADLIAFTGAGTIDLTVVAAALGRISGPSDFNATLGTAAGAEIDISYVYEPGVTNPLRTVTNAAQAACFAAGTRILTDKGERAIESIAVGDRVITHRGDSVEVVWCGRRAVVPSRHPDPDALHPVRITAGAFGPGAPRRDLLVSPDHALFVDGVLIPAICLINGVSIYQHPVARIVWHHIELTTHDVVMAENLPTESYLDTGNRSAFEGVVMDIHPRFSGLGALEIWQRHACARQVRHGPELTRMRQRLDAIVAARGGGKLIAVI
ncbi:MAG: Hint domain-containing protein [Acetobacteraceae bacterium]|nr:Hint domain-containing protein [Acetobacteraceae bacterium]